MKKVILVGMISCGKTTLAQCLNGRKLEYQKTQALDVINTTIDTPGEYLEHRSFLQSLIVTAVDTEQVLFVQDATQERFMFSPGLAASFPVPVAGVVTKADIASKAEQERAVEFLKLAGADPVFTVSVMDGTGIKDLLLFLDEKSGDA